MRKFDLYVNTIRRDSNDCIHKYDGKSLSRYFYYDGDLIVGSIDSNFNVSHSFLNSYYGLDDPLFNQLSDPKHQLIDIPLPGFASPFEGLVNIVIGQQISVSVANKLRLQFANLFGHQKNGYLVYPEPSDVLSNYHKLDALTTNHAKKATILKLCEFFNLSNSYIQHTSKDICEALLEIKGIGIWTVSWFALKGLREFNQLPSTDLAIRKAATKYFGGNVIMSVEEVVQIYKSNFTSNYGCYAHRMLVSSSYENYSAAN